MGVSPKRPDGYMSVLSAGDGGSLLALISLVP